MRRSLILSALSLVLVLSACGDTDSPETAGNPTTTSDRGTGHDDMMDGGGSTEPTDHGETSPVVEGARRVAVSATSFGYDPDEITVTAGEDVAIVLTSDDLLHDFTIEDLDVHVAADRDETAEGGLRADEPGRYTYYCTVEGHRDEGMEGTLIVEAP